MQAFNYYTPEIHQINAGSIYKNIIQRVKDSRIIRALRGGSTVGAIVLPDVTNGPVDIGIAAGTDKIASRDLYIHFKGGLVLDDEALKFAMQRLVFPGGASDGIKAIAVAALVYVFRVKGVSPDCNIVLNSSLEVVNEGADLNTLLRQNVPTSTVATILFAMKVNCYQMGHHIGTSGGVISGYAGKVVATWEIPASEETRTVIWNMGHWLCSKFAFAELGFSVGTVVKQNLVIMSEDMKVRVASSPAGCAKVTTYLSIYYLASKSVFSLFINIVSDPVAIQADVDKMKLTPLEYHTSANYYLGKKPKTLIQWEESDKSHLSAFIYVCYPGSSLANAGTIMPKSEVQGLDVYNQLMAFKLGLTKGIDTKVALKLAAIKGQASGGLAVKSGLVTPDELTKIRKEVEEDAEAARRRANAP
jgi:hypothetical protein